MGVGSLGWGFFLGGSAGGSGFNRVCPFCLVTTWLFRKICTVTSEIASHKNARNDRQGGLRLSFSDDEGSDKAVFRFEELAHAG